MTVSNEVSTAGPLPWQLYDGCFPLRSRSSTIRIRALSSAMHLACPQAFRLTMGMIKASLKAALTQRLRANGWNTSRLAPAKR